MATRPVTVEFRDNIAIVTMRNHKNMLNVAFLDDLDAALDQVIRLVIWGSVKLTFRYPMKY